MKYKIHITLDSETRFILDILATSGNVHESKIFLQRLDYVKQTFSIKSQEAVADRGYGTIENIYQLYERKITCFVPPFHRESKLEKDLADGFQYDVENDWYVCPKQKLLIYKRNSNSGFKIYAASGRDCLHCEKKESCLTMTRKGEVFTKRFLISTSIIKKQMISNKKNMNACGKLKEKTPKQKIYMV